MCVHRHTVYKSVYEPEELIAISFGVEDKHAKLMYSIALNSGIEKLQSKFGELNVTHHMYGTPHKKVYIS